jgi:hypothetical protein
MSLRPHDEPDLSISDDQRVEDIATVLALGVLRVQGRPKIVPDSSESGLALCSDSRPYLVERREPVIDHRSSAQARRR